MKTTLPPQTDQRFTVPAICFAFVTLLTPYQAFTALNAIFGNNSFAYFENKEFREMNNHLLNYDFVLHITATLSIAMTLSYLFSTVKDFALFTYSLATSISLLILIPYQFEHGLSQVYASVIASASLLAPLAILTAGKFTKNRLLNLVEKLD